MYIHAHMNSTYKHTRVRAHTTYTRFITWLCRSGHDITPQTKNACVCIAIYFMKVELGQHCTNET